MSSDKDKLLKPLKEICQNIATSKELNKLKADLAVLTNKGTFYEYHAFVELLGIAANNSKLPALNMNEIFKLMNALLRRGSGDKEAILYRLYEFISSQTVCLDLIDKLVTLCDFSEQPKTAQPDVLIAISEVLLRKVQLANHRRALYRNYENFYNMSDQLAEKNAEFGLKLFQSIYRTVSNAWMDKKFNAALEFLEEFLVSSISKRRFLPSPVDTFPLLVGIISVLAKGGGADIKTLGIGFKITKELDTVLTNKDFKSCNAILLKVFTMCCEPSITQTALKELKSSHYKDVQSLEAVLRQQVSQHKRTALVVSKMLDMNIHKFEATAECFAALHFLAYDLFHILKALNNEEGSVSCCKDAKRHETHKLIMTICSFAKRVAANRRFTTKVAAQLIYHVSYDFQICNELKCNTKDREMLFSYNRLYNVLFEFISAQSLVTANSTHLNDYFKWLYKMWNQLSEESKASTEEPTLLIYKICEAPCNASGALFSANGIASLIFAKNDGKSSDEAMVRTQMKYMFGLLGAVKLLNFTSATHFIKSKNFKDSKFLAKSQMSMADFIYLEIRTVFRYTPLQANAIGKLFSELCLETKDLQILARSCQMISDSALKEISIDEIKTINKLLEQNPDKTFDVEISLALALNNYALYFVMHDSASKDAVKLDLQRELEHLKFLNTSLHHFSDVIDHLLRNKPSLEKVVSIKRISTILGNMAIQYYMRGIKYKDLQCYTLLWHFAQLEEPSISTLLNVGIFFLDNHEGIIDSSGNYIKISKNLVTIEEVLAKLNKIIDEQCISSFSSHPEATQYFILSYLLSLWVYYLTRGRKHDGFKRWNQFKNLWSDKKNPSVNHQTVRSKIYFCLVEINTTCFNRAAANYLSIANSILTSVKDIDWHFCQQFYQIYYRNMMKAINFSINRLADMNHYEKSMLSLIALASRKGHCLKALELISLSILHYLNMEKVDRAKIQLKEITKLLGLKEEILIETPTKVDAPATVFAYELPNEKIRKVAAAPGSPIQVELSMIYEDQTSKMYRQLQTFVHHTQCKCEVCKMPQLQFIRFQIGCHYSRLFWLINKKEISLSFNDYAIEPWRIVCDKLRRVKDCEFLMINKVDFAVFSIRWLFQYADTLIALKKYELVDEIYQEVEIILLRNVTDFKCFQQALHSRKENLNFLLERGTLDGNKSQSTELTFTGFLKAKKTKQVPQAAVPVHKAVSHETAKKDVVYVDSSEDEGASSSKKSTKTDNIAPTTIPVPDDTAKPRSKGAKTGKAVSKASASKAKANVTDASGSAPLASTRSRRRRV